MKYMMFSYSVNGLAKSFAVSTEIEYGQGKCKSFLQCNFTVMLMLGE